jgi:hypothetical protein
MLRCHGTIRRAAFALVDGRIRMLFLGIDFFHRSVAWHHSFARFITKRLQSGEARLGYLSHRLGEAVTKEPSEGWPPICLSPSRHWVQRPVLPYSLELHQEKVKLRPVHPDAPDALDVLDATSVNRTQRATAPCVRTKNATANAYQTRSVRVFSFQTQSGLLDGAVPSGRSRVFQMQPCQLDAAGATGRSQGFWSQCVASWLADPHPTLAA